MKNIKMNDKQFEQYVKEYFQNKYGTSAKTDIRSVLKNNGVCYRGLSIAMAGDKVAPTIYLEGFYERYIKGCSEIRLVREIEELYHQEKKKSGIEVEYFKTYSGVSDTLRVKVINYEENKCLLEQIPYVRVLDLAMICYSVVNNAVIQNGAITVYRSHLEMWGVSEEELFEKALVNSCRYEREQLVSMWDVLDELTQEASADIPLEEAETGKMYVLTNERRINGASVLCYPGIFRRCVQELQKDFYILPSSIHELILIPIDEYKESDLLKMVQEVNDEQVAKEELLSYHVYRYYAKDDRICDVTDK